MIRYDTWYDMIYMIYLLTAIGLPPGGSSTVHIYTQTKHRTTQSTQTRIKGDNEKVSAFSEIRSCGMLIKATDQITMIN